MFWFYSFTYSCPIFPEPLIEETVFSPLYILSSFVIDWLTMNAWVYFWTFYHFPLMYVSGFVSVPYCFEYCSFVVLSEVKEHYSSSFILLSQACFGYLGSFVFPCKFNFFFSLGSSSEKNTIGNLIEIAMNLHIALNNMFILEYWFFQFKSIVQQIHA